VKQRYKTMTAWFLANQGMEDKESKLADQEAFQA